MSERRFVLIDFKHMSRAGCLRLYEAGHTYVLPRAIAHAATKRELVALQRPPGWVPPNMFQLLTEAEVIAPQSPFNAGAFPCRLEPDLFAKMRLAQSCR